MPDDPADKVRTADTFGERVERYRESGPHREGRDLQRLAGWCANAGRALDIATGAGHTAGALAEMGVATVIAVDASPAMVASTITTYPEVAGAVADAERLPIADGAMDAATCRIAAHHFPAPEAFVAEVARVLRPGGVLAFEDNVAPEDTAAAAYLDRLERLHDPSHVRSHPVDTWLSWLDDAGFVVEETIRFRKVLPFDWWVDGVPEVAGENAARLRQLALDAGAEVADQLGLEIDGGRVRAIAPPKVLVRAVRPA